ncbi:MAG: outer membrane protein transport protein [Gemmatimonadales bacterium]|nr:outer membrane protein transport protein [Gemmatimonadales bacterium]
MACGLIAAVVLSPRGASAQGYGVYEQGACVMGRAGTGVASACADGSSIFFNPAGIAGTTRQQLSVGGTLIAPSGTFTNDLSGFESSLKKAVYPVPNLYYVRPVGGGRASLGLGVFAPYGLTTEWNDDFEGRFLGYKSRIAAIYIQPTAAFKLGPRVSFGAGFDLSLVKVQLRQRADLSTQIAKAPFTTFANLGIASGTDFADVNLNGSSTGMGYHLGLMIEPVDHLSFGARYLSRQLVKFDDAKATITQVPTNITLAANNPITLNPATGTGPAIALDDLLAAQFQPGGLLVDQTGVTYLRLPEQLVLGTAWQATPKAKLLFDFQYTNWTTFNQLALDFELLPARTLREAFRKSYGFRFGGEYALSEGTTVRAGYYTHGAAAPAETVTPNLPEGPRNSATIGLGTNLMRNMRVDLAYQYIDQANRRGRSIDGGTTEPTAAVNNGLYKFHAHLVGATFAFAF